MKFSILVPIYNVEQYLEQCVESLLNQTYKGEYEIILVDDGSTDSSGKICDEYAENHPQKVKVIHKKNGGHTSARLAAIKAAIGEYCLFCDSDDFVEENLLETVDCTLFDNPKTDMVMYSFSYYEDGKKKPRKKSVSENTVIYENGTKKELYEILITTPLINTLWTKAVKSEILKNDQTDYSEIRDKAIAEDAYIISNLITACQNITSINAPLYNYRINNASISRSYNSQKIEGKNTLFLYNHFLELLPAWDMDNTETKNKIYEACFGNAMYLFRKHYEYAGNSKNRHMVLEYNWNSMLFNEIVANPEKYGNRNNVKLYRMVINQNKLSLYFFFLRNKIYNTLKKVIRNIKKQG